MVGVWQPTAVYLLIQPECEMLQVEDIAKLDVRSQQCVSDFSGWTEASKKGLIPALFLLWMGLSFKERFNSSLISIHIWMGWCSFKERPLFLSSVYFLWFIRTKKNLNLLHMHAMLNTESEVKIARCATLQHWCKIIKCSFAKAQAR